MFHLKKLKRVLIFKFNLSCTQQVKNQEKDVTNASNVER